MNSIRIETDQKIPISPIIKATAISTSPAIVKRPPANKTQASVDLLLKSS
ncbi:hypothetical protein [uncultured Acetobacterium sp.]|nr:hypothetical protein [uncultured Acetobacterium sp.]